MKEDKVLSKVLKFMLTNFKNRRFKCLTIHINNSIINMYYLKRRIVMLKKYWKNIGMLILIIACVFNIMSKLVHKLSLNKEMIQSAQYIFSQQENENKTK